MDAATLSVVKEDLQHLREDWGPNISEPSARRGSAVLRRLLVEDAYGHAWRALGLQREPAVKAVDLNLLLAGVHPRVVRYALAGGVEYRGIRMAGVVMRSGGFDPSAGGMPPPVGPNSYPGETELGVSRYLSSFSGIVDGQPFTRREVIKYIANVKGGVHLGDKERKTEKKLIDRLGKIEKKVLLMNSDGLLVELIAIGQSIARSSDVDVFLEACLRRRI